MNLEKFFFYAGISKRAREADGGRVGIVGLCVDVDSRTDCKTAEFEWQRKSFLIAEIKF